MALARLPNAKISTIPVIPYKNCQIITEVPIFFQTVGLPHFEELCAIVNGVGHYLGTVISEF
jgi:hypothetical protein